ncbi:uncharacterized protein LOC135712358 [Ochlerotatus camptorhynchus]|uniref:uncharacterized protein LOC135712358 n=1 Tax=Ochlerotatus camptorhynchus TaxID=644619 RepID=UPI0031D3C210
MPDETSRACCSVRIIASEDSALQTECPACDRSGVTDRLMVKCDSCEIWYHSICVGVDESVMDRSFCCTQCLHRHSPVSSHVGKSSTTSAIQARVELQMQRIEEEKRVQERLMREIEEQEKALREKSMQQELESKRKANQQRWELERQFIGRKYNLLQSVNEGDDNVSVRSLRSNRSSKSTVHRWLEDQRETIMAACAGNVEVPVVTTSYTGTIPKRTTARSIITSRNPTTPVITSISSRQAQVRYTDENSLYDIAVGGVPVPVSGQFFEAVGASVPVSNVDTFPAPVRNPIPAFSDLISPPTSKPEELAKTFSEISSNAVMAQRKLEQQILDLQQQMDDLQRQSANQLRSQQDRDILMTQIPAVTDSSSHGRVGRMPVVPPRMPVVPPNVPICGPNAQQLAARHVVPKELPHFDGNPLDWPLFFSSYTNSTQMCGYTDAENLMRLQRCLKGNALSAVSYQLLHPSSVPQVMETLRTLYGRPELVVNILLTKVRSTPAPRADKLESIISFGLVVQNLCGHLCSLGMENHLSNPTLLQELVAASKSEKPKGKEKGFLNTHADDGDRVKVQGEWKHNVNTVEKGPVQPKPCPVCQKNGHKRKECYKFQKSNIDERWKLVQQLHLCRRCLASHGKWPCKAPLCGQNGCELKHHSLLHSEKAETPATKDISSQSTAKVNVHRQGSRSTLFRIVPVQLYGKDSSIDILAFLDDGSSFTLMEQEVADQLGIDGVIEPLCLQWTNNVTRTESESKVVQLGISSISGDKRYMLERVRTVESLGLPPQSLHFEQMEQKFPYLRGLPVNSYSGAVPRILIGLDNTDLMVTLKKRIGKPLEPVATKTKLGWTVYGNVEGLDDPPEHRLLHVCSGSTDRELHDLVEEFFTVESTGVKVAPIVEADDDRRAREIMEKTTIRTPSGRFETGLLWRYDCIEFPESRPMAERRLKCLERKLTADAELYNKVKLHIADLEAKGYIHKATPEELANFDPRRTWFLPLGLVINPNKPGKIRMVWDAAAKVEGVSLNSMLLKGPDLLTSLKSVLHRFRQRQVAVYVKNRNAEENRTEFPEAVEAIVNNHYVDDYLDSRDTEEEAIRIASEVKQVHAKAGFELRNWLSNSEEVVRRVGESSASECKSFATDKSTGIERVLGMRWQPINDEFTFRLCLREDVAQLLSGDMIPTKREVLRVVMSVFDPLGLVAAYVVHGKCLVQDIWRSKIAWDQRIPKEICSRWRQWVQALKGMDRETVPRCYFPGYSSAGLDNIELHVFVDASLVAFSCVAYFRIIDEGQVRCALVAAKSKVAPLKPLSIPRLELQAAVLGSRLMKSVQESHTLPIRRRMIWSDSSTVLSWIQSDQRRYRQFVAVRVGEILSETCVGECRKVPGKLNVADEATKWGKGPCFKNGSRWFTGPKFLYKAESEWPGNELPEPNIPEELRTVHAHHREITEPLIDYRRFSKWERLQRATAYMLRFCANCSGKVRGDPTEAGEYLSQEELQSAEETLFRWIQMETYPDEMIAVEEQHQRFLEQAPRLERTSPLCKLSPMLDEAGMLRMDGRIGAAHYAPYAVRFSVILPKNHYVTGLILNWYHRQYGHGNSETVVNEVRQRFHVSSLRNAVRKVAKTCKWCVVGKATPQPPRMASLPECRLAAYIRPFTFVGVDYCGPFLIRIGRASAKRWVALFVCQTV